MNRCQAVKRYIISTDEVIICAAAAPYKTISANEHMAHLCAAHRVIHEFGTDLQVDMSFDLTVERE